MYCTNCGSPKPSLQANCPHCGAPGPAELPPAPHVPNHLVSAILVTLCCCLPLGIPAIVYAARVDGKLAAGDVAGAMESSRLARLFVILSFGLTALFGVGYLILMLVIAIAEA